MNKVTFEVVNVATYSTHYDVYYSTIYVLGSAGYVTVDTKLLSFCIESVLYDEVIPFEPEAIAELYEYILGDETDE